jgi:hypothetical protein
MSKEFYTPYMYMLKQEKENIDNQYNYRLISNIFLNENNFKPDNKHYMYIFGLFPCKYIPSAYIPLNYKNLMQNINRINPTNHVLSKIFNNSDTEIAKQLQNKIKQFISKEAIYNNINISKFAIILMFFWSIILLLFNYILLYYYRASFNYILASILFILLLFSIIWKIIYTVQN